MSSSKKVLSLFSLVLIAIPGISSAGKSPRQAVQGSILAPMDVEGSCIDSPEGHLQYATQGLWPTGVVAYRFEIDPSTFRTGFRLTWDGEADLDIRFYDMDGVGLGEVPPYATYEERNGSFEKGVVPPGYDLAIVCMFSGADQDFLYEGGIMRTSKHHKGRR